MTRYRVVAVTSACITAPSIPTRWFFRVRTCNTHVYYVTESAKNGSPSEVFWQQSSGLSTGRKTGILKRCGYRVGGKLPQTAFPSVRRIRINRIRHQTVVSSANWLNKQRAVTYHQQTTAPTNNKNTEYKSGNWQSGQSWSGRLGRETGWKYFEWNIWNKNCWEAVGEHEDHETPVVHHLFTKNKCYVLRHIPKHLWSFHNKSHEYVKWKSGRWVCAFKI